MDDRRYDFLSWGAGVQSTALAVMVALGDAGPVDAIVHSDTGFERTKTYESIRFYKPWLEGRGQNVILTKSKYDIRLNDSRRHMPLWTSSGGPLKRQCTTEFKLVPLKRAMRKFAGYSANKHPHPKKSQFHVSLGISWDENERMRKSRIGYMVNNWPLVDMRMTRTACIEYLEERDLPVPVKSSCIGCPFRNASTWEEIKNENTDDYSTAVKFDSGIRQILKNDSVKDSLYVYKGGVPLSEVDFIEEAKKERKSKQLPLFCHGYCGT